MVFTTKCNGCGECCKNPWHIHINVADIKRIRNLGYSVDKFVAIKSGFAEFKRKPDFGCVFLDKDNFCKIEKKHGYESKADVCKIFPRGEFVCGSIINSSKPERKIDSKKEGFINISNKYLPAPLFSKLIENISQKKPLFDSYSSIIYNILDQKENIILEPIKIEENELELSELKKYLERMILVELSNNVFPRIDKALGKEIEIDVQTEKKPFRFKYENVEIKESVLKDFLPYFKKAAKKYAASANYPLALLVTTYHLPIFSKAIAGNKEINVEHMLKALSLLNGLSRFGSFMLFKRFSLDKLNIKLNSFLRKD